jgi:exodeoxyribonuclease VII small subunit
MTAKKTTKKTAPTSDANTTDDAAQTDSLQDRAIADLDQKELKRINALSYEQARDELIEVVQKLENGGLDLDASMRQWEVGEALARRAQGLLDEVRSKLNAVKEQQAQEGSTAGTQANLDSAR